MTVHYVKLAWVNVQSHFGDYAFTKEYLIAQFPAAISKCCRRSPEIVETPQNQIQL